MARRRRALEVSCSKCGRHLGVAYSPNQAGKIIDFHDSEFHSMPNVLDGFRR